MLIYAGLLLAYSTKDQNATCYTRLLIIFTGYKLMSVSLEDAIAGVSNRSFIRTCLKDAKPKAVEACSSQA